MTGSPALSVIIPTYNRARELPRAIKSVQAQSLRDLEIIVCDDCSTDDTASIVEALAASDPRIRYFRTPVNKGPAAARNMGFSESRADFITTLDSDDVFISERKLEEELRIVRALIGGTYFPIAFSRRIILNSDLARIHPGDTPSRPIAEGNLLAPILARSVDIPLNFVFPKALLTEIGGYDPNIPLYEDWDLKIRMATRSKFYYTKLDGTGYVQTPNSLSKARLEQHLVWLRRIFEKNIHLVPPEHATLVRRKFDAYIKRLKSPPLLKGARQVVSRIALTKSLLRSTWYTIRGNPLRNSYER